MKKWNRILVTAFAVIGMSIILPIGSGSVQAQKALLLLEEETEAGDINEPVPKETEEIMPETQEFETDTEVAGTETLQEDDVDVQEETAYAEFNAKTTEETNLPENEQLLIDIEDDIQEGFDYQDGIYTKKAIHTILITREKHDIIQLGKPNTDPKFYEDISYTIYEITNHGEIHLKEGSLKIPNEEEHTKTNILEMEYSHSGNYCIKVKGRLKKEAEAFFSNKSEIEFICHNFSVMKETQEIALKQDAVTVSFDNVFYLKEYTEIIKEYTYHAEYEIQEQNSEKGGILEIGKQDKRDYIKAIRINDANQGITTIGIRLKENPFMEASEEKILTVHVKPMELEMEIQMQTSKVYMYDTLDITVILKRNGEDVTKELFETDPHLRIGFKIVSGKMPYEINSVNLHSFSIPVKKEFFKQFSKGTKYDITAQLKYAEDAASYFPYHVNTAVNSIELLGRKASMRLSAENNGVYDYRTYYKGISPYLSVHIEDTTTVLDERDDFDTRDRVLSEEAEGIIYQIRSGNEDVVSIDSTQKYTASGGAIPLKINGVGTAVLTVAAEGNNVYTVESENITITVEDSPICDGDFTVCVERIGKTETIGFQRWQEYLDACGGWINGSVNIGLTQNGLQYYEQIGMTMSGWSGSTQDVIKAKQHRIDGDRELAEYVFWAENGSTNADTRNTKNKENGTKKFQLGIDTTAPSIKNFSPCANYYRETSTDAEWYFSRHFVLTGTFTDAASGIAKIEYTTNLRAEGGAEWILLEKDSEPKNSKNFRLELKNGSYDAIAVRAVDAAGNISKPVCLHNKTGVFIKIIVDNTPPNINVSVLSDAGGDTWQAYDASGENWTNKEIKFFVTEKPTEKCVGLYKVEYAYQSIVEMLLGEPIAEEKWQELVLDEQDSISFSVGSSREGPENKNGCYYFRGVSKTGIKSKTNIDKRILLWQKMEDKEPVLQSGADLEKCCNEWYNKESGIPVINFAYPKYDTGVISKEYAAPITIHYNLSVKDEKENVTLLVRDKTAAIRADLSEALPVRNSTGMDCREFPLICDDLTELQIMFSEDGIYTLEYWTTDAAGNKSAVETLIYKIDCHEPDALKIVLEGEEQTVGSESTLTYEKFYQHSVSGEASAEYGISGKDSIKILKAKKIGEWKDIVPTQDAEQFQLEPNIRCLLYVRAVDGAGNMAEGWTKGIVVDTEAPTGEGMPRMIAEPEGANKHGFFNSDVKVKISVKDAPDDGNSAGLKLITYCAGTDDTNTISDKELFRGTTEGVSEKVISETESFQVIETIDAGANEGNHAYITVNAADRCENISTDRQEFKIDITKPEIEITFDKENAINGRYYNVDRTAKINIKEMNFDAAGVKIKVTRDGEVFEPYISDWKSDKDNHYAYIDFSQDGDYTLTVECKDLADNEAEQKSADPFTIDKTLPNVRIALEHSEMQHMCFNETQTVIITVTEHNFNADDFKMDIQPVGKTGVWEHKNDTHVLKLELSSEGEYAVSCSYKDLAGNELSNESKSDMPLEFVIDKTKPVIEISGVENDSANAGEVIPNITVRDRNIEADGVVITLTTGRGAAADITENIVTGLAEGGFSYTLTGLNTKPDDVYYLRVIAVDMAGNLSELAYRFSLNRCGSAYDLTDLKKLTERYYNSYSKLEDIKIIEMNVDKVEESVLYASHNANIIYGKRGGRPLTQEQTGLPKAFQYSVDVSGNENTGYVYTYTLYRENFVSEGTYRFGIYSRDKAGNEVNNMLRQNGGEIQFVVDNSTPRVIIDGVENNEIYDAKSHEVRVVVHDNFKLAQAEVTLVNKDGTILDCWNYFDLVEKEGDTACIEIEAHDEEVSLLYRAVDAAGNKIETLQGEKTAKEDFLVTTDKFVQLVNKPAQTPIGRGIIAVSVFLTLTTLVIFAMLGRIFLKKAFLKRSSPND